MQIQPISVKELRQNFPEIKSQLDRGHKFLIIHRSKPLATLIPYHQTQENIVWPIDKIVGGFRIQDKIKEKITPEYLDNLLKDKYE